MVNDRGRIKWTSLMLPEHVEMLRELEEKENDVEMPILSEDKLQEMEETIQQAIEYELLVNVAYFHNKRILHFKGMVTGVELGRLKIENEDGLEVLNIYEVVDVYLSER